MAPMLIFLPAWVGVIPLSMKTVAGLTILQGLIGCLFGALYHRKFKFVSTRLFWHMGIPIFMMSFIGGIFSHYVSNALLMAIFASLALSASMLVLVPVKGDSEAPDVNLLDFKSSRAVFVSSGIGLLGGMVGQGGSFILIPLMTSYVQIPTRIAIGSNLAIVTLATLAGFLGKAFSGQIEWLLAVPILFSAIPATIIGSLISKQVSFLWLKRTLAVLIAVAAVRIWLSVFGV